MNLDDRLYEPVRMMMHHNICDADIAKHTARAESRREDITSTANKIIEFIKKVTQVSQMADPAECAESQSLRTILYFANRHRIIFENFRQPLIIMSQLSGNYEYLKHIENAYILLKNAIQDLSLIAMSNESFYTTTEFFQLNKIGNTKIEAPFSILIEPDEACYIARCLEFPQLYGVGDTKEEALQMIAREINSLWEDIKQDNNLSTEYESAKLLFEMALS